MHRAPLLSAQVVLREANSKADDVADVLRAAGFDVTAEFAGSFSIVAPPRLFETYFEVVVEGTHGPELPLTALPAALRQRIKAVLFGTPPDFGPVAFQSPG